MLRVAICDDKSEQLEKMYSACKKYLETHKNRRAELSTFQNPVNFLEELENKGGYDIVLLDICMPGISGIAVAKEIRKRKDKTEIILLTTSNEFAVEAFSVDARHYLLKPFSQSDFDDAMDRAAEKLESFRVKKIYLNGEGGGIQSVDVNDILYVESFRNGRAVFTTSGTYTEIKRTLTALLEELESLYPKQFVSPYRGYIVNFDAVNTVTAEGIVLKNGQKIPIKPGSFRKLRDSFFEWAFGKEG